MALGFLKTDFKPLFIINKEIILKLISPLNVPENKLVSN
jgi:hypothetical protein